MSKGDLAAAGALFALNRSKAELEAAGALLALSRPVNPNLDLDAKDEEQAIPRLWGKTTVAKGIDIVVESLKGRSGAEE
jgi:hypothetical protein